MFRMAQHTSSEVMVGYNTFSNSKFDSQLKMAKFVTYMSFDTQWKHRWKPHVLDHISRPHVIFICLLIGHQDFWIKRKQIEHKNNTLHQLRVLETMYTEFLLARCLPSSENLNGLLVFVLCTFRVGLYNEWMRIYIPHIMSHGGLQFYWVRSNISLWRRLWLPLSVHFWSHSPTQPMHEMWDETRDRPPHRELRALLFSIQAKKLLLAHFWAVETGKIHPPPNPSMSRS